MVLRIALIFITDDRFGQTNDWIQSIVAGHTQTFREKVICPEIFQFLLVFTVAYFGITPFQDFLIDQFYNFVLNWSVKPTNH